MPFTIAGLPALALLLSGLLTLLACGQMATPTPTTAPAVTEVATPAPTEDPVADGDGGAEVKVAVQQLFDTWNRALQDKDAALFHSVLRRELAESCGLEQLQSWLDQGERFFAEGMVRSVFLDVADPRRAFAEIISGQRAGRSEVPLPYPWPVAMEEGEWRAGFHAGLTAEGCPYIASSPPPVLEFGEGGFPQIPGLDLDRRRDLLAAVPGTRVLNGSFQDDTFGTSFSSGGSMSPYDNQVNIYAELETDSTAAESVRLYRDALNHPSWDILEEVSSDDFGWFSWTVLDGEGLLWHGRLVVVPSHESWKQVWLSLYSDDSGDSQ